MTNCHTYYFAWYINSWIFAYKKKPTCFTCRKRIWLHRNSYCHMFNRWTIHKRNRPFCIPIVKNWNWQKFSNCRRPVPRTASAACVRKKDKYRGCDPKTIRISHWTAFLHLLSNEMHRLGFRLISFHSHPFTTLSFIMNWIK